LRPRRTPATSRRWPPGRRTSATGTATFTANGTKADILLDNPGKSSPAVSSISAGDANNVTIVDSSPSQLILADLDHRQPRDQLQWCNQTGPVSVAGTTSITSTGGNVDLGSTSNDFDTVEIDTAGTAATVDLGDTDGITFVASTLGTGGFTVRRREHRPDRSDHAGGRGRRPSACTAGQGRSSSTTRATGSRHGQRKHHRWQRHQAHELDGDHARHGHAATGTAKIGGDITITANGVSATGGPDSITTTGGILLQPLSKTTTIGVATTAAGIDIEFAAVRVRHHDHKRLREHYDRPRRSVGPDHRRHGDVPATHGDSGPGRQRGRERPGDGLRQRLDHDLGLRRPPCFCRTAS